MKKVPISTNVEVDFLFDLGEVDEDDLIAELKSRGKDWPPSADDLQLEIEEMYYAFKFNNADRAIELARLIAQEFTGRII